MDIHEMKIRERFNEYCANAMGYTRRLSQNFEDVLVTPSGIIIAKYDPWNDDEQLINVGCVLADNGKLPHNLDVRMSSIQVLIEDVRDYIRKYLMDESTNSVLDDIKRRKAEIEEKRMQSFKDICAGIMGWQQRANSYYSDDEGWIGDVSFYNPYESPKDLQPVLDILKDNYGLVTTGSSSHAGRDLVWWFSQYGDECPKVDEGHPYEQCAGIEDDKEFSEALTVVDAIRADYKKREERKNSKKLFNEKCAEMLGWTLNDSTSVNYTYYVDEFGFDVAHVNDWNPYDSFEQMRPVLAVLANDYGVHLYDAGESKLKDPLELARQKISELNLSPKDEEKDVLDAEEGWDEYDRKMDEAFDVFNIPPMVVDYPVGAAQEPVNSLDDAMKIMDDIDKRTKFNRFCAEITNSRTPPDYDPWNDLGQLESVVTVIGDLSHFVDEWVEAAQGRLYACRALVEELMANEEDEWDKLGEDIGNDFHAACKKLSDAFGTDCAYPNVKEEQSKFNAQCRKIMFRHSEIQGGSIMLPQTFDPYYNGTQLIDVLEIVLRYIPNSIHCMIAAGQSDTEGDEDITHGLDVGWHMRQFIKTYGTDEWMTPPLGIEETFNNLCKKLCEGYNIMPTDENYNPFDCSDDLIPILPVIIRRVDEPFTIPGNMDDMPGEERYNCDIHDNMVHYVSRHAETVLGFLE